MQTVAAWQHWVVHAIYNAAGQLREFQAIGQDITDRKRAEEANRNLAHAARLAMAGELTAMVAHEVNQPLSAILSNAEAAETLLQSPEPPLEQIRQILEDICQEDLRASEVMRRMRTHLRNREIQLQPLDLNETASGVLRLVASDARHRRVQLSSELAEGLPLVSADRMYLEQVLINLIVNGIDAMQEAPDGARELTLKTERNGDGTVEVGVTDRGRGIPADAMTRIFESFFTTKPTAWGSGSRSPARSSKPIADGSGRRTTRAAARRFASLCVPSKQLAHGDSAAQAARGQATRRSPKGQLSAGSARPIIGAYFSSAATGNQRLPRRNIMDEPNETVSQLQTVELEARLYRAVGEFLLTFGDAEAWTHACIALLCEEPRLHWASSGWDFERRRAFLVRLAEQRIVPKALQQDWLHVWLRAQVLARKRDSLAHGGLASRGDMGKPLEQRIGITSFRQLFRDPATTSKLLGEIELHIQETRALVRDIGELSRRIATCSARDSSPAGMPFGQIATRS